MGRLIRSLCLYARLFCERLQYEIFCNLLNKTYYHRQRRGGIPLRFLIKSHGIFFEAGWFSYLAQGGFLFRMPIWTDDNF